MSHIPEPPWAQGGWDPTIGLYPPLTYSEVLCLSPLLPQKREVGRGKLEERSWKREDCGDSQLFKLFS